MDDGWSMSFWMWTRIWSCIIIFRFFCGFSLGQSSAWGGCIDRSATFCACAYDTTESMDRF
ncbi:hypothetical protein K504DRAFT_243663 [Pleomassaria siparia CBS 279.74]|uniref:Uncharacterized protein n=1 Tax=Pleomassaria siparia CBS 279.74 TaxID=1314801 RepID=A0A6G1KFJ3_9PLEO|nr:hypothetical protein K504DRAFT_243663 [Pleomassaria siparia CBS 279.74]